MVHPKRTPKAALGLSMALMALGCTTAPMTSSPTTQPDNVTLRSSYSTQQVTGETIRYCRSRFRRCFRELSQTLPASQANEECRDNYETCLTRNEGYFIRR